MQASNSLAVCNRISLCLLRERNRPALRLPTDCTIFGAMKDGLIPSSDSRSFTPLATKAVAPGSRIANRGVKRAGVSSSSGSRLVRLLRNNVVAVIRARPEQQWAMYWRHEPRRLEGFSLVGGVPKVTITNCDYRVPKNEIPASAAVARNRVTVCS